MDGVGVGVGVVSVLITNVALRPLRFTPEEAAPPFLVATSRSTIPVPIRVVDRTTETSRVGWIVPWAVYVFSGNVALTGSNTGSNWSDPGLRAQAPAM